ncbi:MAG: hypothetical protein HKO64_10845, partial [Xanthomonadales bacterium]|nr:hypothetical protein [Xanthomonadales bacterium]
MQQKRKIVPPVYLVLTMGAVYAADRWLPIVQWVPDPVSRSVTLLFLALGLLLIGHSAWSFSKVDTG